MPLVRNHRALRRQHMLFGLSDPNPDSDEDVNAFAAEFSAMSAFARLIDDQFSNKLPIGGGPDPDPKIWTPPSEMRPPQLDWTLDDLLTGLEPETSACFGGRDA